MLSLGTSSGQVNSAMFIEKSAFHRTHKHDSKISTVKSSTVQYKSIRALRSGVCLPHVCMYHHTCM